MEAYYPVDHLPLEFSLVSKIYPTSPSREVWTDDSFIALSRSYARWTIGPKFVSLSLLVLEACGADRSKHREGRRGPGDGYLRQGRRQ